MSMSRPPHRRKHSTAMNASSSSFSLKNPYEDVLLSKGGKVKFEPHEYAEIFSGSSSIPVLDVSGLGEPVGSGGCRSSELDYSNIFGGAKGDDVAVPYEQLFTGGVKKTKRRTPADAVFQEGSSLNSVGEAKRSSGAFDHSTDGIKKQFNMSFNKTNQRSSNESNGETHVTELHDVPGFTHFVDGTPQLQKKEGVKPVPPVKRDVSRTWSFSSGVDAITVKDELCPAKSYIPDKSCNVNEINFKSHIAKEASPLGRPSGPNDNEDIKQSNLPSSVSKETAGENSQPLFDEELDETSDAAVSIAALKKAIEQAQESIRLAKMIMQKKREGIKDVSKARRSKGRSKIKDKNENRTQHVPGGLEENNMSEEFRQLDHAFPMFIGVDGKSAPIPSHTDNLLNSGKAKVETVRGDFEAANDHADGFIEVDKKFAPSCSQSELLNTVKEVEVEKIRQNVTVVLESGKVDSNYNLICSKAKAMPCLEHMETNKETVEQRELTMHQLNEVFLGRPESVAGTFQSVQQLEKSSNEEAVEQSQATVDLIKVSVDLAEQLERVLKCSGSTQEQEKTTHEGGGNLRISRDSEAPDVSDGIADCGKCAKKFVGHEDLCSSEHLKVPSLEFNTLQNESQSLATKNIMDHANFDKKPDNVPEWEDDGQDGKCSDDDGSRMVLKEEILWFENELQLEGPLEEEISERDPGIFPGVGGVAIRVDMVLEPEIDDNKLNFKHEEGNQTVPRESEESEIAVRCVDAGEHEAVKTRQTGSNNYSQVGNGEIPPGVEKISNTDRAAGVREEPESIFELQDSSSEKDKFEDFDAHSKDSGTVFSDNHVINIRTIFTEVPEPCNIYFDNEAKKYQSVLKGCDKEDDSFPRETETLLAVEENEAGLSRDRSLKKVLEGQENNTFEAFAWDSKSSNADNKKTLPKDEDMLKTTTEIHNTAQEHAANSNVNFFPEIHVSTSQVEKLDDINAKPGLQQNSESIKESHLSSSLENKDDVSAQESPAFRANAVDTSHTTADKEELKGIVDLNSDETEDVGQQNECLNSEDQSHLSQTNCEPKEIHKSAQAEREMKTGQDMENLDGTSTSQQQDAKGNEQKCDIDDQMQRIEAIKKGREREKDRIAVERAIREARERAFAEARERAERAAVERAAAEARQRVVTEVQEKAGKASIETKPSADKTSVEAKLRAERAAVERAIAEARERAREKATSQKTSVEARVQEWISNGSKNSNSSSDLEKSDGATSESAQRRKARSERHQRIMERAGKALAEKNMRDLIAQKEQAERNRLAETLDADVKRWATGKQGNLRALLSTLQYILGPESGWQPVSLTEIVTTAAVKKAYRKATLCVHPDKLQQRGATIRQKYICEKIFDLLKAAWNRFNSEES